ncbi:MAG TPA: alpha/beta fold hydrolase [Dehalococcoidales bacterium]|nr:MAG: hypothetical protein A2Z05_04370 [Chloroflexi bacterium RBG_16_60_22]HJX13559.1 alpha/beta fold hydrolase [Dehalococcoidales bacterium]
MLKDYHVLQVDGISIVGQLFLPDAAGEYPLACICHGVPSGNPPEPGDGGYPALAERVGGEGFAVFIFNFRGTGDSGGNLDIFAWTRDLRAVIDFLWERGGFDRSRFSLVGFSGGAAVSVYVASHDARVSGVAAAACPAHFGLFTQAGPQSVIDRYRRIGAIRDADFPPSVEGWFDDLEKVTPLDHVAGIAPRPLLLVHGDRDETVPVEHARQLYARTGEPRKLVIIEGAGHRLRREERAVNAIIDWLKSG